MENNHVAYWYEQLVKAWARESIMTEDQREDLLNEIYVRVPVDAAGEAVQPALLEAAEEMASGDFSNVDDWAGLYREYRDDDYDPAAIRASFAPVPDETRAIDSQLSAMLAGTHGENN